MLEVCFVSQLKASLSEGPIWGQVLSPSHRAEGVVLANCLCSISSYAGVISPEGVVPGGMSGRQLLTVRGHKSS